MTTQGNNLFEAHTQWATRPADQRFKSLAELSAAVKARRVRSRSVDLSLSTIQAGEKAGTIVLNHGIKAVEPTHWSFGQFSGWIGAPAKYLRTIPQPLAVQCLNHGLQKMQGEELKFMAISRPDDPNGINTLQAVTSKTYGRIWDADVVDCAERIVERTGGKFHNPLAYVPRGSGTEPSGLYASDRDVFIFMIDGGSILESGPRAQLSRGFFMFNSEVGSKTFGLTTFLFNHVCGNHIVWGAQDVRELRIRHTENGPARFDSEATPALLEYANRQSNLDMQVIRKAQEYLLPTKREELVEFAAKHLTKVPRSDIAESIDAAVREEGECRTLWQLVQGVTAYARGFDFIDARVELETKGGKLLDLVAA